MLNAVAGLLATFVGIVVAFVPSRQVTSIWLYEIKLVIACLLVFGSAYFFYRRALRAERDPLLIASPETGAPESLSS